MSGVNDELRSTNINDQMNESRIQQDKSDIDLMKSKIDLLEKELLMCKVKEEYMNKKLRKYKKIGDVLLENIEYKSKRESKIPKFTPDESMITDSKINMVEECPIKMQEGNSYKNNILANPHYDIELLNKDQAREVIAYIYNNLLDKDVPNDAYDVLYTQSRGIPNTLFTKIVDVIGELVYGPNNYIGPSKTGYADGKLIDVLTNVPALNVDDAKARVHDIATIISSDVNINKDLPALAQIATYLPTKVGVSRRNNDRKKEELLLSGDIEENPGPGRIMGFDSCSFDCEIPERMRQTLYERARELENRYIEICYIIYTILGYDAEELAVYTIRNFGIRKAKLFWDNIKDIKANNYNETVSEDVIRFKLMLSGDVEENPGPPSNEIMSKEVEKEIKSEPVSQSYAASNLIKASIGDTARQAYSKSYKTVTYRFDKPGAEMDALTKLASNPTRATSFLNAANGSDITNVQAYINDTVGQFPLRSALDNMTDIAMPSCNNVMLSGYNYYDETYPSDESTGARLFTYKLQNLEIRQKLSAGTLGIGLDGAMKAFTDFLAVGRTNTNAFTGDPMLELSSRIVASDYGNYINLAKLLTYSSLTEAAWGSAFDRSLPDYMTRGLACTNIPGIWYPGSDVAGFTSTRIPVINAWWMNQTMLKEVLLGEVGLPNNMNWNDTDTCAFIPISRGYSIDAMQLIALCHLEFPVFEITVGNTDSTAIRMGQQGVQPDTHPIYTRRFCLENVLVRGPKYNVIFIMTDNSADDVQIDGGTFLNNIFNAGTDIAAILVNYWTNNISSNIWGGFAEAMDYFLKLADSNDWMAACIVAGNMIQARLPYLNIQLSAGVQANSIPLVTATDNITINSYGTVPLNQGGTARAIAFYSYVKYLPLYNSFGFPDMYNPRPITGTGADLGPRNASAVTGWFQNNTPLTTWGILTGCLKKDILSGTSAKDMYKSNRRPIHYAIKQMYDIVADMAATWMNDFRVTNELLYDNQQKITDRRIPLLNTLASMTNNWQRQLAGVPFLRCGSSALPIVVGNLDVPNWGSSVAFLYSPIVLSNKFMYDNYFKVEIDANMIYGNIYNEGWEQARSPIVAYYGINIGGLSSQCVPDGIMYKSGADNGDLRAETMYAISRWKHLVDINSLQTFLNIYMVEKATKNIFVFRPITQYWSELLAAADASNYISNFASARPGLITTIPTFPQEYDPTTGLRLLVGISNNGYITGYQPGLSLLGLGSATAINTDSYVAPGDKLMNLAPGSNLF